MVVVDGKMLRLDSSREEETGWEGLDWIGLRSEPQSFQRRRF